MICNDHTIFFEFVCRFLRAFDALRRFETRSCTCHHILHLQTVVKMQRSHVGCVLLPCALISPQTIPLNFVLLHCASRVTCVNWDPFSCIQYININILLYGQMLDSTKCAHRAYGQWAFRIGEKQSKGGAKRTRSMNRFTCIHTNFFPFSKQTTS